MSEYAIRKVTDDRYVIMKKAGRCYMDVATTMSLYMAEKIVDVLNK